MFDKSLFKDRFREWAIAHFDSTEQDARTYCHSQIPAGFRQGHQWLIEQSIEWFRWYVSVRRQSLGQTIPFSKENDDELLVS